MGKLETGITVLYLLDPGSHLSWLILNMKSQYTSALLIFQKGRISAKTLSDKEEVQIFCKIVLHYRLHGAENPYK